MTASLEKVVDQPTRRFPKRAFLVTVLAVSLPFLGVGLFAGDDFLIRFFPDDGFYYTQTAVNFVHSGIISFDGVNPTNGFHPLFFLVASAAALVFPKQLLLHVLFLLNAFLIFSTVLYCLKHLDNGSDYLSKSLLYIIFSLPVFFCYVWISCGLEAGLVVWATAFFFHSWVLADDADFRDNGKNMRLGLAMAVLMLARLDLVLVLPPFIIAILFRLVRSQEGDFLTRAFSLFLIPLVSGLLYLGINLYFTGHLVPISGGLKKVFPESFRVSWRGSTGGSPAGTVLALLPLLGSAGIFVAAGIPRWRKILPPEYLRGLLLLNLALVLYYLYLRFFCWHFFFWYFAFPVGVLLVNGMVCASSFSRKWTLFAPVGRGAWLVGLILVCNIAANSYFLFSVVPRNTNATYHLLQIARAVDRICGPEAVIGTFDAGIIGFYTRGRVINLDGLANNYDYLENYRIPQRYQEYFSEQGITHLLVRTQSLKNRKDVLEGKYETAIFGHDRRVNLPRENELFRYHIPENFSVYLFKY